MSFPVLFGLVVVDKPAGLVTEEAFLCCCNMGLGFGGVAVGWQGNGHVLLKFSYHPRIVASHQPSWFTHEQFPKPDESWERCAGSILWSNMYTQDNTTTKKQHAGHFW